MNCVVIFEKLVYKISLNLISKVKIILKVMVGKKKEKELVNLFD